MGAGKIQSSKRKIQSLLFKLLTLTSNVFKNIVIFLELLIWFL